MEGMEMKKYNKPMVEELELRLANCVDGNLCESSFTQLPDNGSTGSEGGGDMTGREVSGRTIFG